MTTMQAIATNQSAFPLMVLVYEVDDNGDYVVAKIGHADKGMGYYVGKQTARKYKLYESAKRGYYFKWNGVRFYLDECLRTNF